MAGPPQTNVVAVLTRAPSAGGKSRLFAALGRPFDPDLLTALLLDTLDATDLPGVMRVAAVTPGDACDTVRALLPPGIGVMSQHDGDLGERMRALMQQLFDNGARRVVVIGSDLPALPPRCIAAAFTRLESEPGDLVLGPATDGGYYLVGASRVPPVFDGVEWGSTRVLMQTCDAARRAGMHVHLLEPSGDVDAVADLRSLPAGTAPRTTQWARSNGIVSSRGNATSDGFS